MNNNNGSSRTSETYENTFNGEKAVTLKYGSYEAIVLPEIGANLIAFRDLDKQFKFLHEPAMSEMDSFKEKPMIHGIPVLFPPNRYEDGQFTWENKTYTFPINEPSTGNHLHGFLYNIPWNITQHGADELDSNVTLELTIDKTHSVYEYFPHLCTLRLKYTLSENGLQQHILIRNDGEVNMPCLLGFHTSINVPFASNSSASDYTYKMTIGQRWELNKRMLPTGKHQPLQSSEEKMKVSGISPFHEAMDNHYTAEPQDGRNRMELTDHKNEITLVYDVGNAYKQWMIYNNNANAADGFFCPEPQINIVNAPNVDLPSEQIGMHALEPGGIWEATSRLYCKTAH